MKQMNLNFLLDNLLNTITSNSFLRINKRLNKGIELENDEFVRMSEAPDGHFLVLPKGFELLQKSELEKIFSSFSKDDVGKYKLNCLTQDYLERNGVVEKVWNLLAENQLYTDLDLSKHLNQKQLEELKFHRISNLDSYTKTKGYWFWRLYFETIYLNKQSKIYRIYCKEWGNRFWVNFAVKERKNSKGN